MRGEFLKPLSDFILISGIMLFAFFIMAETVGMVLGFLDPIMRFIALLTLYGCFSVVCLSFYLRR